jgi:fermentation-respiration switch protein FrsA (DUF1100 family)
MPALLKTRSETAPPLPLRRRLPRTVGRFLLACVIIYAVIIGTLYFQQGHLIFGGSNLQGNPDTKVVPVPGAELITLRTAGGDTIYAVFGAALTPAGRPDPRAAHRPSLLYFYGSGSTLSSATEQIERLRRLGANVMVPEYVGYGMSGGTASEANCHATADAAYAYLLSRKDVDPKRIVAVGSSLGGAMAIDLASRKPVAGLMTFMTFTSMAEMSNREWPIIPLPLVRVILKHPFLNESKIAKVHCPVFIVHGLADTKIPYSMSDRLAAAAGGPVTRLAVQGAGHGDLFIVGRDRVYPAIGAFLKGLP